MIRILQGGLVRSEHQGELDSTILTMQLGVALTALLGLMFFSGGLFYLYTFNYDVGPSFTITRVIHFLSCVSGCTAVATWTGRRVRDALALAGAAPDARAVELHSVTGYGVTWHARRLPEEDALLATRVNGARLSSNQGFLVRLIVPGYPGQRMVSRLNASRCAATPKASTRTSSSWRCPLDTIAAAVSAGRGRGRGMPSAGTQCPLPSQHPRQAAGHRWTLRLPMLGMTLGVVVAVVLLLWAALVLARLEGNDLRALVPVWLWTLPALGLFSGAGWLLSAALAGLLR